MIAKVKNWFSERIPITGKDIRDLTHEPVPNHMKHWWFCLGGTPAFLFLLQVLIFFHLKYLIVVLLFLIIIGYIIRTKNLKYLIDATNGKYIPMALDPFVFLDTFFSIFLLV